MAVPGERSNNEKRLFTQECIYEALLILLRSGKKLDDITVSELTEKAGVSRMAFYRSYKKITDVALIHLNRVPLGYTKEIDPDTYDVHEHIRMFFMYFKKNHEILEFLIDGGHQSLISEMIVHEIRVTFQPILYDIGFREDYQITALTGIVEMSLLDWVKGDMKETPAQKAAQVIKIVDLSNIPL